MKFSPKIFFIMFSVIGLNVLSGGWLETELEAAIFGEPGQFVIDNTLCLAGLALYNPIISFFGFNIPSFSVINVSIAVALSAFVIFLLEIKYDLAFVDLLKVIAAVWITLKMIGWWFITHSVPNCSDFVGEDIGFIGAISLIFVPIIVLSYLMGKK